MPTKTQQDRFQALEALLKDAREEADSLRRELKRLQNVLVSTRLIMGHELKKPTTAISGYLELALEDLDEVRAAREANASLEKARDECQLLNELNLFFIELLKLDHGEDNILARKTDVAELIDEVIERAPKHLDAEKRVKVKNAAENCDFMINANAVKIIVSNLVENALAYTPNGVTVDIERSRDKRGHANRELLKIRVCDRGKGIPKSYLQKIFNPFVRLPNSDESEGSGLGLTLVRSLVELCDGSVYVDSSKNKGMTVHVTLPELQESSPAVD